VTSDDHLHDALITALRSPARPDELAGEDDAVAAMCAAYQPVPARAGSRSRRGVVLAVVTVASLGVGGLAAAGPGIFTAPFTSPFAWGSDRSETDDGSLSVGDDPSDPAEAGAAVRDPDGAGTSGDPSGSTDPARTPGPAGTAGDPTTRAGTTVVTAPVGPGACEHGGDGAAIGRSAQSTVPPGPDRGDATSDAARTRCEPGADPAVPTPGDDEGDGATDGDGTPGRSGDAPGQGGDRPGVGNDGEPGPPVSTPGQGQPPTDPGPPAQPPANPGQGQPPADPGPPAQPPANPGQGQPPADPGPPAQPPGQDGGNNGGGNNGGGNGGGGGGGGGNNG
jgi:hypothetical protein